MKKIFLSMITVLITSVLITSCTSDDEPVAVSSALITLEIPANLKNVSLSNAVAILTNVETQHTITVSNDNIIKNGDDYIVRLSDIDEGLYNIMIRGHLDFEVNNIAGQKDFEVTSSNVKLSNSNNNIKLSVSTFTAKGGFVISEIFFTGSTTPEGKSYSGDQYIKITNNSDVVLYADSLAIVESAFLTTTKQNYNPDIMATDFSVQACYMIPGTGRSVAVSPGESLTLAINAINHTAENPNSTDLRNADFEFYDESSNPKFADSDSPVPNLDKWYCYTATIYGLHNRGFNSIAIAKMKTTKEDWIANYVYDATYTFTYQDLTREMTKKNIYRIPNTWIIDGVNLSVESIREWNVLDTTIDAGWTYCGKVDKDDNRYNKSVIRKTDSTGKYIDTNNSSNDFIAEAPASLLKK